MNLTHHHLKPHLTSSSWQKLWLRSNFLFLPHPPPPDVTKWVRKVWVEAKKLHPFLSNPFKSAGFDQIPVVTVPYSHNLFQLEIPHIMKAISAITAVSL